MVSVDGDTKDGGRKKIPSPIISHSLYCQPPQAASPLCEAVVATDCLAPNWMVLILPTSMTVSYLVLRHFWFQLVVVI